MYHKIIILGNVGKEPELKYTPSGQAVINFFVATNRKYSDSRGNGREETTWFRISAWGRLAEICSEFLEKSDTVLVEGVLNPDENGNPKVINSDEILIARYEVTAKEIKFIRNKQEK